MSRVGSIELSNEKKGPERLFRGFVGDEILPV